MSTQVGAIHYDLDLDDKKFSQKIDSASAKVNSFGDTMRNAEKGSQMFATGLLAIGAAATTAIGFGVKIAGDLESARQGFVALLGSAEEADATMARIKKEAAATPFELTGLVEGAQALTAVTKDGDKAVDTLLDVGKAIATSGKGQEELDRVVLNLQQISSTGKVTAMDIRQFQSAIPMFNDIVEANGMTLEGLQESETAAEDLFEAFRKAGEEGGITSAGFTAQAGTFNQLWSNLVDTVTIGLATFVQTSGIFDTVKQSLSGVIDALGQLTTPENIQNLVNFITENFPIIAGIIIGGLVPAVYALASAFIAAMVPLLPFIAAGAAIGLLIKVLVEAMGGWEEATKKVKAAWDVFAEAFNKHVMPALNDLWKVISEQLLPQLKALWDIISPILIPILKVLATIVGGIVIASLRVAIEVLKVLIGWVAGTIEKFNSMVNFFKGFPQAVSNALSGLKNAITQPFTDAWQSVKDIAGKIKDQMDRLSPFHRESPSLVDNITKGVDVIRHQLDKLGDISMPQLPGVGEIASGTHESFQQNVNIAIDSVGDMQDVNALGREFAFRTNLVPGSPS
jgi:tape measure domain-containing protein